MLRLDGRSSRDRSGGGGAGTPPDQFRWCSRRDAASPGPRVPRRTRERDVYGRRHRRRSGASAGGEIAPGSPNVRIGVGGRRRSEPARPRREPGVWSIPLSLRPATLRAVVASHRRSRSMPSVRRASRRSRVVGRRLLDRSAPPATRVTVRRSAARPTLERNRYTPRFRRVMYATTSGRGPLRLLPRDGGQCILGHRVG